MSFGPTQQTKQAMNTLGTVGTQAQTNSANELQAGGNLLTQGGGPVQTGVNFFNTLANGNRANTTALLQPNINQIRANNQGTLQALNTLMPRGGGRSGTLFGASYAPTSQITDLFSGARTGAAAQLPQLGLAQQGLGANLTSIGNQPLSTAASSAGTLGQLSQAQQQMGLNFWSGLGSGILGLATTPFGGGTAINGLLGKL